MVLSLKRLIISQCAAGSWVIKMAVEYAVYKGDKFIDLGTADYLAAKFGVKADTIRFRSTPTYKKRVTDDALITVRIEDD